MSVPSPPTGYDVAKHVSHGRADCHLTVGFDREQGHIPRFLVMLHYQISSAPEWEAIARMDHNETSTTGHDVYREGLHVDIVRRSKKTVHLDISHAPLPSSRGRVTRDCVKYLRRETDYIIGVYEEQYAPGGPPQWPDGGNSIPMFIRENLLEENMSEGAPAEAEILTIEELTALLAEATDTTPEEIEEGAEDFDIAPLEEAEVVGYGDSGPLTDAP